LDEIIGALSGREVSIDFRRGGVYFLTRNFRGLSRPPVCPILGTGSIIFLFLCGQKINTLRVDSLIITFDFGCVL
jgi:hypothetical protein